MPITRPFLPPLLEDFSNLPASCLVYVAPFSHSISFSSRCSNPKLVTYLSLNSAAGIQGPAYFSPHLLSPSLLNVGSLLGAQFLFPLSDSVRLCLCSPPSLALSIFHPLFKVQKDLRPGRFYWQLHVSHSSQLLSCVLVVRR